MLEQETQDSMRPGPAQTHCEPPVASSWWGSSCCHRAERGVLLQFWFSLFSWLLQVLKA